MATIQDPVVEFRASAERFIQLVEAVEPPEHADLYRNLAASLSQLYWAALALPSPEPESEDAGPKAGMSHEDWTTVYERILKMLGDDHYWTVEPFGDGVDDEPSVHLQGSVGDDLADIYRDLQDGFAELAAGAPVGDVVWGWRFSFWTHWGEHAVNALRVIHARLANTGER